MYEINKNLVARADERCFFDSLKFRVLQFNATGYQILSLLGAEKFSMPHFLSTCCSLGVLEQDARAFWSKCLENAVVTTAVEQP